MILLLTDSPSEAAVLGDLCDHRAWPCATGASIADFKRISATTPPRVVVVRHRLADGYSDDVMAELGRSRPAERPRVIVLMACTSSIQHEARQVNLGADCVLRDPLRIEVLFEYLARYRTRTALPAKTVRPASPDFEFAGVHVAPHELLLTKAKRQIRTTPRVVELLTLLHRQTDRVAPYALIYSEVFGRRFTGDTSNCRVLVAKTAAAFQRLGVNLRSSIDVVPKSGYRYRAGK